MNRNYKTTKFYICKLCNEQNTKYHYMKDIEDHYKIRHIFKIEKTFYIVGFTYINFDAVYKAVQYCKRFLLIVKYEER